MTTDPLYYFTQAYLTEDAAMGEKILVSELVQKGQKLADCPDSKKTGRRSEKEKGLKAGKFTEFSDDGLTLLASVSGYPRISMQQEEDQAIPVVSITPLVNISFDRLSATLLIYPPLPDKNALCADNLEALLLGAGISHGIDKQAVEKAKQIIAAAPREISDVKIAEGTMPQQGSNAYLDYALEIGPIAGLPLEDGSIDFRERRIMVGVEAGELIATKIPAVPGTPGINVLGEQIEPRNGKDVKVKTQGDAHYSEENHTVTATQNGVLSVVRNNTIKVSSRQKVEGDIDFKTGNIDSQGCLTISGSVLPGFKVKSSGDLKIGGGITSAQVVCGANCVVTGGITGKSARVVVGGDADIKFIEQSALSAGGIIVIRSQSYFSDISSQSDIRCNPASIVMGGSLIAAGNLTLGTVGTEDSEPATLGAGIDPERLDQYRTLRRTLSEKQDELIQWIQLHGNAQSRKVRKMEREIEDIRSQLIAINLIPGTELFSRTGAGSSREDIEEQNPLYHAGLDVQTIRIDLHGS
ncbi:MAG: FapA family protein, partial [Desulfocapsaceae bacterium]|nr:FapA family protein [Desulfocapsaceae bacterium]